MSFTVLSQGYLPSEEYLGKGKKISVHLKFWKRGNVVAHSMVLKDTFHPLPSTDEYLYKPQYSLMGSYLVIKSNELPIHTITWMCPEK